MKPIINNYYKGVQEARSKYNHNSNSLTIGITNTPFENHFLPEIVTKFCSENPMINIFIQSYDHNTLKRQLLNHECDLIFATQDDFLDNSEVNYIPLIDGYFIAEVPEKNQLAEKMQINISDFENQHIILMDNSWCPPEQFALQEKIRRQNKGLHIAYVNNVAVADLMCRSNLGISMMPNFITSSRDKIKLIPINYDCTLSYGLAKNEDADSKILPKFIKFCKLYKFKEIQNK